VAPAEEAPAGPKAKGKPRPDRLEKRNNEQG